MLIPIDPVDLNGVECVALDASLAAKDTVNLSAVPVDKDGAPIPGYVLSVLLGPGHPLLGTMLSLLTAGVTDLFTTQLTERGFTAVTVVTPLPPPSQDELAAQARQGLIDATAALDAVKARYEDAIAVIEVPVDVLPVDPKG